MRNKFKIGDNFICKNNYQHIVGETLGYVVNKTYSIIDIEYSTDDCNKIYCIIISGEEEGYYVHFTVTPDRDGLSYETFFYKAGRNLLLEKV